MTRRLVLLLVFTACDPLAAELADSRDTLDTRLAADSSYTYARVFQSYFGFSSVTRIEVVDGVVVARHYHAAAGDAEVRWTERGEQLGSHDAGEPLRTLPELYDECDSTVLTVDREVNDVYLELDTAGLLARCVYVPKECRDDCTFGIDLAGVDFAQP